MSLGRAWASVLTGVIALSGCSTAPTHSSLVGAQQGGQLAPLLPLRRFIANADTVSGYVLSPDGERLLWVQTVGTDVGLATRATADAARPGGKTFATGTLARPYAWLPDSRHALYTKDFTGDENTQLFVFDTQASDFQPWAVTPWPGVRSVYLGGAEPGSGRFFLSSNRRDRATFDLYEADSTARTVREVARSDGRVLGWIIGTNRQLAGRVHQLGDADGSDVAIELLQPNGSWKAVKTVNGFDSFWITRTDVQAGRAWGTSNIGRDKVALIEFDLATGQERVLAQHAEVDLSFGVWPPRQGAPIAYVIEPGLPRIEYLDAALGADVQAAVQTAKSRGWLDGEPVITRPSSIADDQQRLVLRAVTDYQPTELLLDRKTKEVVRLTPADRQTDTLLAPMKPFSFKTSDGLTVHGYVVRPRGVSGPAPLVVNIHGGPWARDSWQPADYSGTQLLANRGYAVLNVNYRGSTGYGRAFMMAGKGEYFGRMQKDIAEAVQWAIDNGIADRERVAVFGASFGGFSVLSQLVQKPHAYRCGVDVVGVANWPRVIENWPPFWRNRHYFALFYGDVAKPEERAEMLAKSPISHVEQITAPLLVIHGANDIRVLRQDSDEVVAALRKLGRPVQYMEFANEGHGIRKWRNRVAMWRQIEDTLAQCLGGRSNGFDLYQLMPR